MLFLKFTIFPFELSCNHIYNTFDLIHCDVWGPSSVASLQEFFYYVLFVDICSRFSWILLTKHKYEVLKHFTSFRLMVDTQFGSKIKILQSDGAKEYCNSQFVDFLDTYDTTHQFSCPYTP